MKKGMLGLAALGALSVVIVSNAQTVDPSDVAQCHGSSGPSGPCSSGPGGGLSSGPGGGLSSGPGGGLSSGPGGGMSSGPSGGLSTGPGGGLSTGPGGGLSFGPRTADGYNGPWGPCITGVLGRKWMSEHCPQF